MMGDFLQPTHLLLLAFLAVLLFGAKQIPELGRGLGAGLRGFKEGLKGLTETLTPDPSPRHTGRHDISAEIE